ncbi:MULTISPECIES: sulfatase-like hydrolase/transferase [unclassified Sulfitobacter]|uniref:sulfatase-like hydrolase/transferase n=2 Tax=Sulfitobacter TaxID=60136 RepID=UPI0007C3038B|nr:MULTISPECIES: sulfatase-like hydrolase/transferase [unclassified Sulfitobacter]KZX98474.1 phosphonate monoester hydrolase [Sulfitobacter sp. HI0023]KZZ64294.1 phosphonate monoester hydrolase [Sulfitobacter sp. HI0129]
MPKPNILFIMYDQLRADYLGCYGHPTIDTPAMDALAARGVRFERAYCQSPVCGPSRMSFYTGRYVYSHGSTWNDVPLPLSEWTIADYLQPAGYRVAVVGESHFPADRAGMQRLEIPTESALGRRLSEGGFEPWERDDQIHPDTAPNLDFGYNRYLRAHGYDSHNPWHDFANSAEGPDGEVLSGWQMRNAHLPTRVPEEHSETAYFTNRAMAFIEDAGDQPWCLHLSYMKPHWPYMAPAPYHEMYGDNQVLPAVRDMAEKDGAHPVMRAFMDHDEADAFQDEAKRRHIIPTYMGLIRQADDHLARLMAFLEERGQLDNTLVVLTSDHGSYLGDHWLGEKSLFHEQSARIPLIVVDPSPAADATRGRVETRFAEAIDLLPTFVAAAGEPPVPHRLEGRSLLPILHDETVDWREAAVSEHDYAFQKARLLLGRAPSEARSVMIRTERWKYIHFEGFRPQLFDMETDPEELHDLGDDPAHEETRRALREELFLWFRTRANRTTMSDEEVAGRTYTAKERGVFIELW